MRKGSKKPVLVTPDAETEQRSYRPDWKSLAELSPIDSMIDILTRICDACHEMDTRTEPWDSIRKDIERLK